jgi:hypothetical protein
MHQRRRAPRAPVGPRQLTRGEGAWGPRMPRRSSPRRGRCRSRYPERSARATTPRPGVSTQQDRRSGECSVRRNGVQMRARTVLQPAEPVAQTVPGLWFLSRVDKNRCRSGPGFGLANRASALAGGLAVLRNHGSRFAATLGSPTAAGEVSPTSRRARAPRSVITFRQTDLSVRRPRLRRAALGRHPGRLPLAARCGCIALPRQHPAAELN